MPLAICGHTSLSFTHICMRSNVHCTPTGMASGHLKLSRDKCTWFTGYNSMLINVDLDKAMITYNKNELIQNNADIQLRKKAVKTRSEFR